MNLFTIEDLKIPVPIVQGGVSIGISLSGLTSAALNIREVVSTSYIGTYNYK